MLYITTRDDRDAYTAYRALHENAAPDGGAYIPFHMPFFTPNEVAALETKTFSETVSSILNLFFSCGLSAWDVDFSIGRNVIKLETMSHRMVVAELWHNPDGVYRHIFTSLFNRLCATTSEEPTEWFSLGVNIAVLFGIYGEMCRENMIASGDKIDITTTADTLPISIAALYARQMGLPVDTIIFTCDETSDLWDLIHLGEMNASFESAKDINYERLIHAMLGNAGVAALRSCILNKKTFRIDNEKLASFNNGLFCSVTGKERSIQNVNSIYRSNAYILDPMAALSVGGLQDYRAKTGESKLTLVLSCTSPMHCITKISDATGISKEKLSVLLKNPQDRRQ